MKMKLVMIFLLGFILIVNSYAQDFIESLDFYIEKGNTLRYLKDHPDGSSADGNVSEDWVDIRNLPSHQVPKNAAPSVTPVNTGDSFAKAFAKGFVKGFNGAAANNPVSQPAQVPGNGAVHSAKGGSSGDHITNMNVGLNYQKQDDGSKIDYNVELGTLKNQTLKIAGDITQDSSGNKLNIFLKYTAENADSQVSINLLLNVVNNLINQLQVGLQYNENPSENGLYTQENLQKLVETREELMVKKKKVKNTVSSSKVKASALAPAKVIRSDSLDIIQTTPNMDGQQENPVNKITVFFTQNISNVGFIAVIPVSCGSQDGKGGNSEPMAPGRAYLVNNQLHYMLPSKLAHNTTYIVKLLDVQGQSESKDFEYTFKTESLFSQSNLNKAANTAAAASNIIGQTAGIINTLNIAINGGGGE